MLPEIVAWFGFMGLWSVWRRRAETNELISGRRVAQVPVVSKMAGRLGRRQRPKAKVIATQIRRLANTDLLDAAIAAAMEQGQKARSTRRWKLYY